MEVVHRVQAFFELRKHLPDGLLAVLFEVQRDDFVDVQTAAVDVVCANLRWPQCFAIMMKNWASVAGNSGINQYRILLMRLYRF